MLNFRVPELTGMAAVNKAVNDVGYMGSDASFGNIFLLRKKYGTLICIEDGFLFRYYNGEGSRRGYTFPLGNGDMAKALHAIEEDARQNGRSLEFCLVTACQATALQRYFGNRVNVTENRGDSDYIYTAESLATLEGKDFRKKRNHLSRFKRNYSDYELTPITAQNLDDALKVETEWLKESDLPEIQDDDAAAECSEDKKSRNMEFEAITEALENMEALGMKGAILYVYGKPAGMTMATKICEGVWDIHFEKVIGVYAANGGYTAINKLFAASLTGAKFINREEDINIEGLRKAKLSYYPHTILSKSHATIENP